MAVHTDDMQLPARLGRHDSTWRHLLADTDKELHAVAGERGLKPGWFQEGNRNDGLFWAANRALESGLTDLGELADAARSTGLDEREIARTLASARRRADRSRDAEPPARSPAVPADRQQEAEIPSHDVPGRAASRASRQLEAEAT